MKSFRLASVARAIIAAILFTATACDEKSSGPVEVTPALTRIDVTLSSQTIGMGQSVTASAAGFDQNGASIAVGTVVWSVDANTVATINDSGRVTGLAAGTAKVVATASGKSGELPVTVVPPPAVKINEVESNGGTPGDWAELYNATNTSVDLSGWVIKDSDDTHIFTFPAGSIIAAGSYYLGEEAGFGYGLGSADAVRLFSPFGVLVDTYVWTAHAATTYGRCPNGTGAFTTTTTSTKGAANDCSVALNVKINEVESSGGTPGDWVELYNAGATTVDVSGFFFKDNDDTRTFQIAAGTTIAPGAYLTLEEAQFGFGLGQPDAARLFKADGVTIVDAYNWDVHAATTYGRCPNITGVFVTTTASTKGAANACPAGTSVLAWPGSDDAVTVDGLNVFGTNLSGLIYEGASGGNPAVLWGARNNQGSIFRLIFDGTIWTPDPTNGWSTGKSLRYLDGTGNPDTEDVTFTSAGAAGGMYTVAERNNDASTISRNTILRFDPAQAGTSLTATNEWTLTTDLPVVGANLGLEAITWIPDTYLVANAFFDEAANHVYVPAEYANHGTGIFFVGVEGNGVIYAYALNHATNGFTRIATIASGFPGVMALQFDRELNYLWGTCDDTCGNKFNTLEIDTAIGSLTRGKFVVTRQFDKPASLPNINNEGFAIAPQSECVGGLKRVYWADDNETGGHAIRRASLPCARFQ